MQGKHNFPPSHVIFWIAYKCKASEDWKFSVGGSQVTEGLLYETSNVGHRVAFCEQMLNCFLLCPAHVPNVCKGSASSSQIICH
jgi:hypothetical protein